MICRYRTLGLGCTFVGALVAVSCGKAPPPAPPSITIAAPPEHESKLAMTLAASADTNPTRPAGRRRLSCACISCRTDAAFDGAEFFRVFDDDQKVLGPELISRDEFVLAPSEKRTMDVALSGETRFVGAVAAFRDIRNAQWRGLVPASKSALNLTIERARIVLTVAANCRESHCRLRSSIFRAPRYGMSGS